MRIDFGFRCPGCSGRLYFGRVGEEGLITSSGNSGGTGIVACGTCHATFYVHVDVSFVPRTPPAATVEEQRELELAYIEAMMGEGKAGREGSDD